MYNKLSVHYNKKRIINIEDGPPEKKLISDGDIYIKQLAEKQRNTKINLDEQLSTTSRFYKSTELIPLTNYTSGSKSLQDFSCVIKHVDDLEKLKSHGLTSEEIELYNTHRDGHNLHIKYKNISSEVLNERLANIFDKLNKPTVDNNVPSSSRDRLKTELILSTKPNSLETKLMKFALQNEQKHAEHIPHPMDEIKKVEQQLFADSVPVNVKKIQRKARALAKQVNTLTNNATVDSKKLSSNNYSLVLNSKWDVKELKESKDHTNEKKVYTCKSQNYYTVKNGEIVKISETETEKRAPVTGKLTLDEIRSIPKFKNYEKGAPSKTLFVKNLANAVCDDDIRGVLGELCDKVLTIRVMKGKMQGQAFLETSDEDTAGQILNKCNGVLLKNKPLIIQFGKSKFKS